MRQCLPAASRGGAPFRDGLGAVAVGPAGNDVAGTMGGGMQGASALLGKK
jgi:hypothetical protein